MNQFKSNQMESQTSNTFVNKKKSFFVRLFYFLIFLVILPFLLIFKIFSYIHKAIRFERWKNSKLVGEDLILYIDISAIDLMEGYEFENYIKTLLFYLDYDVKETKKSHDFGADLLLTNNGNTTAVQIKRYNKPVGSKAVQEIVAAKAHYGTNDAMVISSSNFTIQAEELARDNMVQLVDRAELSSWMEEAKHILRNKQKSEDSTNFDSINKYRI